MSVIPGLKRCCVAFVFGVLHCRLQGSAAASASGWIHHLLEQFVVLQRMQGLD